MLTKNEIEDNDFEGINDKIIKEVKINVDMPRINISKVNIGGMSRIPFTDRVIQTYYGIPFFGRSANGNMPF